MADIVMPQLGETVTEGTITRWLKSVGDQVAEDEVLFEVSTDKVDSEVPSPAAGILQEILVQEGETVDVGTKLATIGDGAAGSGGGAPAAEAPAPQPEAAPQPEPAAQQAPSAPPVQDTAPVPEAPAPASAPAPAPALVSADPAPAAEEVGATAATTGPAPSAASNGHGAPAAEGDGKVLSPVVRRLISEYDLDAGSIPGTGAGGRITRSDVLAVIDQRGNGGGTAAPVRTAPAASPSSAPAPVPGTSPTAPAPAPGAPAPAAAAAPPAAPAGAAPAVVPFGPVTAGERDEVVPFTNIRRRTAEHMIRSKHTSAHTMVAVEVDYAGVESVRSAHKAEFKAAEGFSLTYLPFIARAAIDAIASFPHVNSSVGEDALIVHRDLNLGIAVDLDFEGLLVPVIHQADGKRMRQLAREISGLAGKARSRKLTMDDISGGTLTITNAGPFGTFITVPVINQPQVAILSTDGVRKRPVAVELPDGSDAVVVHPVGNLVMSWDHRAFDGAYAAAFLAEIKRIIETRDWAEEL